MALKSLWLRDWVGLIVQNSCPLCQRSTSAIFCRDCEGQIHQCKVTTATAVARATVAKDPFILAWGQYRGTLKRAITALKYQNHPEVAQPLGEWLAHAWQLHLKNAQFTVIPIPMHASKRAFRGRGNCGLAFCQGC